MYLFLLQMHHPIQMKPADSENRNGKWCIILLVFQSIWYLNFAGVYNYVGT